MRHLFALHFARLALLSFILTRYKKGLPHNVLAFFRNHPHDNSYFHLRDSTITFAWGSTVMLGFIGTVGVVSQMALLAFGYSPTLAMGVGFVAAVAWIGHAVRYNDRWLLTVNAVVLAFAGYGLIY